MFSKEEVDAILRYDDFKWAKTGNKTVLYTKDQLLNLLNGEEVYDESSPLSKNLEKKDFQFWKKCYNMLKGKHE